jgi:creatinine amidohydrolase
MSKPELCSMTWAEAAQVYKSNPVILIPMGSIEEHGPQTPVGDYRYTTEICRRVAEQTGAISCPTIPWGYSEYFKAFPGTISIRPETLTMILEDHLECLLRFGLDHIIFVCGHKGNLPILEQLGRKIRLTHKLRVATMEPLGWCGTAWKQQVYGDANVQTGHGSDPMQSLAMSLFPDEVRLDLVEPGNKPVWQNLRFQGTATTFVDEHPWHLYLDYDELTPNGVIGDPTLASAAVGAQTFDYLVEIGCKVVRQFAQIDTRIA